MKNQDDQPITFIITGMHRSGTSLTSSLMENAGINIGTRLIGATPTNPKGHFENWDFVNFHADVLQSQQLSSEGWITQKDISVSSQWQDEAKLIIEKNLTSPLWGWKDPRTTLFLNFWKELLPQAYFIFTYRAPWEVADSLYRRGDETFSKHPTYALDIWKHYNQLILDFYHHFPDQSILLNVETVMNNHNCISQLCENKFGIELKEPAKDIIDKSLMVTSGLDSYRSLLIKKFFPEVIDTFNALNDRADIKYDSSVEGAMTDESLVNGTFYDWLDSSKLRKTLKQLEQAKLENEQLRSQLQQSESSLQQSESNLQQSESKLFSLIQDLNTIQNSKLWRIKNALLKTKKTIFKEQ